jgi:hypothetical protein
MPFYRPAKKPTKINIKILQSSTKGQQDVVVWAAGLHNILCFAA